MSIHHTSLKISAIALAAMLITLLPSPVAMVPMMHAQGENPCGVVDAIDYPVDGISIENDDFGMYRAVFNGRHSGIDVAFGRYGDPVRAAARGRVTLADPEGWDTEKGVVILEHTFPDDSIFFTVYGHMEQINDHPFPKEGRCVERGDVIGSVGHPSRGAPHLHYEVRRMKASTGGPGYWYVDPLDGGWLHPIDFTEQWRLRLTPAFRQMVSAGGAPTAPPLWGDNGVVTFSEEYHLERRGADGQVIWRLDVQGLDGIIGLPDGRILGRTTDDQIILVDTVNGRFAASWQADRPLRSLPILLGESIVFLGDDNRAISYDTDGKLRWQTEPLGDHIEHYVQSGDLLAVATGQDNNYRLSVINASGNIVYQASAAAPITPVERQQGGFIIMVASQIAILNSDMTLQSLMDVGQPLGRNSHIALDPQENAIIYPGQGQQIFSYTANGALRWQAALPTAQTQPPLLGIGSGCLAYVLTSDGSLFAYRMSDGAIRGLTSLYAGGTQGHPASRFLKVSADDQVQFSAGFLSIATIDGPTLANDCKR